MEFPDTGKNCAQSLCQQLDFLPLKCNCGQIFCSEHFSKHVQNCKVSNILEEENLKVIKNVLTCSHFDCKERSIIPLICEKCKKHLCVKHRHLTECQEKTPEQLAIELERYTNPVQKFTKAKAEIDKQIENTLENAKKKGNGQLANKIQLMKIKSKAVGLKTIPIINRVYFNVSYHLNNVEKTIPLFVSNQWTVGRSIDAIAQEMRLVNNNNKSNELKLRLFKKDDNEIIAKDVSVVLDELLKSKILVDGENLIIQYVAKDCVKINT